jgi:uncharacterized protein DUF6629
VLGALLSAALAYSLAAFPVSAGIEGRHVEYRIDTPLPLRWTTDIAYVVTTVLPPFISSSRAVRWAGVALLIALIVAKVFYFRYFGSVWCFFAALISIALVLAVRAGRRQPAPAEARAR